MVGRVEKKKVARDGINTCWFKKDERERERTKRLERKQSKHAQHNGERVERWKLLRHAWHA